MAFDISSLTCYNRPGSSLLLEPIVVNGNEVTAMPSLVSSIWQFRRALNDLSRTTAQRAAAAHNQGPRPLFARRGKPIQPADVKRQLEKAMLVDENVLEDVNYGLVVPNDYVVELNQDHYERHFRPIERQVTDQWRDRLLDVLNTTNSRYGRKKYHFGGRVRVAIHPVMDLAPSEVRVRCQIDADVAAPQPAALIACLEQLPAGRRWMVHEGVTTIGRDPQCDIYLDDPVIQQRRLISGQHAHIRCDSGRCRLLDGVPSGKPSVNGTYVNSRRVDLAGVELNDGDIIILAALDPAWPRPDTPGAAGFIFRVDCSR